MLSKKSIATSLVAALNLVAASLACVVQVSPPAATLTPTIVMTTLTPSPTPRPAATDAQTATIQKAVVNLRDTPGGAVVGTVTAGQVVEVVEIDGDWVRIADPAGWLWRGCLSDNPDQLGCAAQ